MSAYRIAADQEPSRAPKRSLWHRIEHLLGWNRGTPECFYREFWGLPFRHRELWIGFRCHTCGSLERCEQTPEHINWPLGREKDS